MAKLMRRGRVNEGQVIDSDDLRAYLEENPLVEMTCTFTKKEGEERVMKFMYGVEQKKKGRGLKFDPAKKGMIVVFDLEAQGYRMLTLNKVTEITWDDVRHKVM